MRKLTNAELKQRRARKGRRTMPVAILLEKIRSIHNVGAFFRTADCAGVEKVFLCGWTAAPPRKEIAKVALGAEEVTPWQRIQDPVEAARAVKAEGYRLIAIEQTTKSENLYTAELPFPCCLVFGNEVEGVSEELLAECDAAVEVPTHGTKESLNASVCAGAVLFEVRRKYDATRQG
jgi:23S rRNA (guanosine2251-2'-O)-methyltransferase